jgi:transcriptional regulator with XRE-family HTH domain
MEKGLTRQAVADRCEEPLRASSIGGYERGERALTVQRFVSLARALGVSPEALLRDTLAQLDPDRGAVSIDLSVLPDDPIGRRVASFAHAVRARRGDYLSTTITLRAGDLEVIASDDGLSPRSFAHGLGKAVLRYDAPGRDADRARRVGASASPGPKQEARPARA